MSAMHHTFTGEEIIVRLTDLAPKIAKFKRRFPGQQDPAAFIPAFTWDELEDQLIEMAGSHAQARAVKRFVYSTRKNAPLKPTGMVVRDILVMAHMLMDSRLEEEFRSERYDDR